MEDKVIFTDYISQSEKAALYKGAKCLLSPSYWEGFGMHILESMACGTPVIISSQGSLPEVAGSTGIYVNPYDINEIESALAKLVMMNKTEYNKLSGLCIERSKMFTWEKTAEKTLSILDKACK
jgi:glycosyltransferase involved in cell wall biosynthesis